LETRNMATTTRWRLEPNWIREKSLTRSKLFALLLCLVFLFQCRTVLFYSLCVRSISIGQWLGAVEQCRIVTI
jgi:hypothetical protein